MGKRRMGMKSLPEVKKRAGLPLLDSLGVATEHYPRYVNLSPRPHTVDVVLLSFIIKGEAEHWMGEERYNERGVSLGVTHYGESHSIVTGPEGVEIMNIYLHPERDSLPELPEPLRRVLPDILPLHRRFRNQLNRMSRLSFERPELAVAHVMGMHRELQEGRPGWQVAAMDCFRLFLMECCRSALRQGIRPSVREAPSPSDGRMEKLRQTLDADYQRQFTLDGLSEMASLNRNYLCRAFKRYTGKSLFEYLAERRLQAAMLSLRSGGDKISSIAFESGFRDLSFFNRKFKEIVGRTPAEYRKLWS